MGKLKSSIKSLQEAITSLKETGPICVQDAKTHSFRAGEGLCSSFSCVYHTSSSSLRQENTLVHIKDMSSSPSYSSLPSSSPPADGRISCKRFFFSPHNTKSIMEEVKETSDEKKDAAGLVYEESEAMAMVSDDPYRDFKCSMAEMMEAHEIREWQRLEELLHCFLRLNDMENHKIIVHAFVDLLIQIISEDSEMVSFSSADSLSLYQPFG